METYLLLFTPVMQTVTLIFHYSFWIFLLLFFSECCKISIDFKGEICQWHISPFLLYPIKHSCLTSEASPGMKVDCYMLRTPAITNCIRILGCRPTYSYSLASQMSIFLCKQACMKYRRLSGLS